MVGLLLAGLPWAVPVPGGARDLPVGAIALLITGLLASVWLPRLWRTGPKASAWAAAGLVGVIAVFYYHLSWPLPGATDISQLLPAGNGSGQTIVVTGQITSAPKLTRSQRLQFNLWVQHLGHPDQAALAPDNHTGKVYVTVPLLQGTGLYSSQTVTVSGRLYRPPKAEKPGDFDFARYLQRQGIFAGLNGSQVEPQVTASPLPCGSWQHCLALVRQRIVRSHVRGAGVPAGPLISAMAMGRRGVDLDFALRDQFAQVGLAHALAASGFHVSLLLGVVLAVTRPLRPGRRCVTGLLVLLGYVALTGAQPSILRASLMGGAALVGMASDRKVISLRLLLLVAVVLLLAHPLWINDLGFQFSFLATLGLMVTVPALSARLDWLPGRITPLVAVPMAAFLWTLPLQLFTFGSMSPYTVLVNVLATPLVMVVCIGGIASGLVALAVPLVGSGMAWVLAFPAHGLIWLVDMCCQLPGSSVSVGAIALWQLVVIYGLFVLLWWRPRWQRRWWLVGLLCCGLVLVPGWLGHQGMRVTVLNTGKEPVMVVQDHGLVGLINAGDESTVYYTVLPFLQRQGINRIDWAIAPNLDGFHSDGWVRLAHDLPVRQLSGVGLPENSTSGEEWEDGHHQLLQEALARHQGELLVLEPGQAVTHQSLQVMVLAAEPGTFLVQVAADEQVGATASRWLWVDHPDQLERSTLPLSPPVEMVLWTGSSPPPDLLEWLRPEVAIAASRDLSQAAHTWLQEHGCLCFTDSLQWTSAQGFQSYAEIHSEP
jgi:competence protein ComEC